MGLIVHHLGHSQSDRVVFLCEELELKNLHPFGASPVIQDDGGIVLAESEACVEYISNIHGKGKFLVKPGAKNYADFLFYYHVTNGTLQPAIGRVMALSSAGLPKDNAMVERYTGKIHQVLGQLDERLKNVPWLAGDEFTAADIMVIFALTTYREFCSFDISQHKNLIPYIKRIVERPAYKSYLKKGDPDIEIEKYINGPPPPLHPALQAMSKK